MMESRAQDEAPGSRDTTRQVPLPRILLVDDSKSVRQAMCKLLEAENMSVETADSGQSGLDLVRQNPFDLVVTDLNMPGMNGFELCRAIKDDPATKALPVIILSVQHENRDVERGFEAGASAYVAKKDAFAELPGKIRELIEKSSFAKGRTILIVDDSRAILGMVREGLEREGFATASARNGQEALDLIKEGLAADLVLTDLDMPVMNGRDLCRNLQADPRFSSIPLVVMSGTCSRAAMKSMVQEGAASYIAKPFQVDQLSIHLEKLLSDQFRLMLEEKKRIKTERTLILSAITSLINALEARDAYTRGHSESVAHIAVGIGGVLGLNGADLDKLELAGRLHDLGKIGVRDNVLLKPGKLTDEEYEHIKSHTVIVEDILRPITSLSEVLLVATTHHERWDGAGYPRGIKGEDIPLMGRITAVADVYDALTSKRPYRDAMPEKKALEIIRDMRGTNLCPTCAFAFLKWKKERRERRGPREQREMA